MAAPSPPSGTAQTGEPMATIKHYKVVAALPGTLEPDAIYLVRVGSGYDQFVTNGSGTIVAYPLNNPRAVPFWLSDGTRQDIPLTAQGELPFWLSDGTPANIPVVTNG